MIHKIRFSNFYSFKDESEINFVVKKAPKTNAYTKSPVGDTISKINIFIGANASGKTNALKGLAFMKWFLLSTIKEDEKDGIEIKPFLFRKIAKKDISLSVDFELDDRIYSYSLKLNTEQVLSEKLEYRKTKRGNTFFLFERNLKYGKYSLKTDPKFGFDKKLESKIKKNTSVISVAEQFQYKLSKSIINYWNNIFPNVSEWGYSNNDSFKRLVNISGTFYKEEENKKEAQKIFNKINLGFAGINVRELHPVKDSPKKVYYPFALHKINGIDKPYDLAFSYESHGTQNIYCLLPQIITGLKTGGVVILDELDTQLHPEIIEFIINLFKSKKDNPKNAQLIFSSQNHWILNILDKQQIFLVDKNDVGSSELWRLDEIKGVRADDNYFMKYIAGIYGATPNI